VGLESCFSRELDTVVDQQYLLRHPEALRERLVTPYFGMGGVESAEGVGHYGVTKVLEIEVVVHEVSRELDLADMVAGEDRVGGREEDSFVAGTEAVGFAVQEYTEAPTCREGRVQAEDFGVVVGQEVEVVKVYEDH